MPDDFTSIMDKADWKQTIHRCLESAVRTIGKDEEFWYNVERAIQAMSAKYPNWDAHVEVQLMVQSVIKKHDVIKTRWILSHTYQWAFNWNRDSKERHFKNAKYLEILQNLENIAGRHRMLLWGVKSVRRGHQMDADGEPLVDGFVGDVDLGD
jgi:hypothetical protein